MRSSVREIDGLSNIVADILNPSNFDFIKEEEKKDYIKYKTLISTDINGNCFECGEQSEKCECLPPTNSLTREEKIQIMSSCMEGLCRVVIFDEEMVKNRIITCLKIAEDILC